MIIINPDDLQKLNKSQRRIPILKQAIAKEQAKSEPNPDRIFSLDAELQPRLDFVKKVIAELQTLIKE